jgi:hypothetical protein
LIESEFEFKFELLSSFLNAFSFAFTLESPSHFLLGTTGEEGAMNEKCEIWMDEKVMDGKMDVFGCVGVLKANTLPTPASACH